MYTALIVSAGSGKRMNLDFNKVFYKIKGKTIIEYSVELFSKDQDCEWVIVVCSKTDLEMMQTLFNEKNVEFVLGGETRQDSVLNGLRKCRSEYVFIHDGARPNVKTSYLQELKEKLIDFDSAILCCRNNNSVLQNNEDEIDKYLNRDKVCFVQTPQAFITKQILEAHVKAKEKNHKYLDDASVYMSELKKNVKIVFGDETNIKVTTKSDLKLLEVLL